MDVEAANLPSPPTTEAQYSHKWNLMATLKTRILAIRSKMAKQCDKVYHENGLCYLFTCVYAKMIEGEPNNINNNDVQYPDSEKVESQEEFSMFQKLQIPKKAQIKKGLDHQAPHLLKSQRKHPKKEKALLKAMERNLPLPRTKLYCN